MESALNFVWMMIQTVIALTVVCGLAYLLFRVVLPRFTFQGSANSMVRVIDRVPLDARKSLCVVEVAGKFMLISISESGVQLVSELDPDAAKSAAEEIEAVRSAHSSNLLPTGLSEKIGQMVGWNREGK